MKKCFTLVAGFVFLSLALCARSYQSETNLILEKFVAGYPGFSITKGPTEIIVNDTSYAVAGAVSNGNKVVAVSWKGQRVPGQNAVYVFLQYDTTAITVDTFGSRLFRDIAAQFHLTGTGNTQRMDTGKVFPNPSPGLFTLTSPHNNGAYILRIFNGVGKFVRQKKGFFAAGRMNIDLTGLPKGNYVAKMATGRKVYVYRLLIQ